MLLRRFAVLRVRLLLVSGVAQFGLRSRPQRIPARDRSSIALFATLNP